METAALNDVAAKTALADRLQQVIGEVDRVLGDTAVRGDEKLEAMREKFADQLRLMRAQLEQIEETAVYRARKAARLADRTVHRHPYQAIGIAAAIGVLVGVLAARR